MKPDGEKRVSCKELQNFKVQKIKHSYQSDQITHSTKFPHKNLYFYKKSVQWKKPNTPFAGYVKPFADWK